MVYRIYVEKKENLAHEAISLKKELKAFLQISELENVRIFNRYDAENIDKATFDTAVQTVFSEPQQDNVFENIDFITEGTVFAVEYLPGQFDQRAQSASECIQFITQGEKPLVKSAKVYVLEGNLSEESIAKIKSYVINPVEAREASLELPETIVTEYEIPTTVATVEGFIDYDDEQLKNMVSSLGLAMDFDDIKFCQSYFKSEKRNPTLTEIRMIDTYWSDHCRHTTFLTTIDDVKFEDPLLQKSFENYVNVRKSLNRTKPMNLMDVGTIAAKYLKATGNLPKIDESEEINACTVKTKVTVDGEEQDWLFLFKNETHNHPTEIEPFGGAATCIGGAIRDPLSGRSYVYAAMRLTGAGNPLKPVEETIAGKLPQRKIVTTAAAGYSSYGNQIGLATGIVDEIYHDGYVAKHMELGAVLGAAPAENVRREVPAAGDVVILLGGRTGRDGIGGATGSSKSHTVASLESCGAEVQKGNAPEERKLQRLFRSKEASLLIKRCNDFGAGGVSVAIGELADGLTINLNAVPKKYEGLDGTELAISESQERMAVVVAPEDEEKFKALANAENLEATKVAVVTDANRLVMNWNGVDIVDISRDFLNSNGAEKHIDIVLSQPEDYENEIPCCFEAGYMAVATDLNVCSKRGLSERFDSTIGAGSVLMPFGGKNQLTPIQAMVHKFPVEKGYTEDVSYMSWGYNPMIMSKSPYHGAYLAVVESISKLIATGASFEDVYLTFQEFFEKPMKDAKRWGKPLSALLGAFQAQLDFKVASIGGKDSMSGTFEKIDVPPTLVSFAVTTGKMGEVITNDFKKAGSRVYLLKPEYKENKLPDAESLIALFNRVTALARAGKVKACYTPGFAGVAEAVMKMCFGNGLGFSYADVTMKDIFGYNYGAFVVETDEELSDALFLGTVTEEKAIKYADKEICLDKILKAYEDKLESVYPCNIAQSDDSLIKNCDYVTDKKFHSSLSIAKPKVLIPAFPGTNCEYDTARAWRRAGADPEIFVVNNLTSASLQDSIKAFADKLKTAQMVFVPGGFSGGDEPDGSGKFITAFFRNPEISDNLMEMLKNRDGLMAGICNGFQALVKLGLVPYGKIIEATENDPTLTFNTISRHQSKIVRTRVCSNNSPWLMNTNVGDIYNVPISHGEGKFIVPDALLEKLIANGQVITQYVDLDGKPTSNVRFNPNDSVSAIEGIVSEDGRVLGKMGHSERIDNGLYKNVSGNYDIGMFDSAVKYYK